MPRPPSRPCGSYDSYEFSWCSSPAHATERLRCEGASFYRAIAATTWAQLSRSAQLGRLAAHAAAQMPPLHIGPSLGRHLQAVTTALRFRGGAQQDALGRLLQLQWPAFDVLHSLGEARLERCRFPGTAH